MIFYQNGWKLSKYKIYYTDTDISEKMENFVGPEGLEWWKNVECIQIDNIEEIKYTDDELKRYDEIKDLEQSENSKKLECYIKNIEFIEESKKEEPKDNTTEQEKINKKLLKTISDMQLELAMMKFKGGEK